MDLSQGQGPSQENIIIIQATTPSISSANVQPASVPPSPQVTQQGGQQMQSFNSIATASIPQLVSFFQQLRRSVMEAEKDLLEADNSGGEAADLRRQNLREKLDHQKQLMLRIRDIVSARTGGSR
jgi:hypothetical protein